MDLPYYYNYSNVIDAKTSPSGVHVTNTATATFFRRYLLQKAMSVFEWTMPKFWSKDYFLYSLYIGGSVAIIETDRYGVIPQGGQPSGYNVFYQPRQYYIGNPLLSGIKSPIINEQCTVFKCTRDWGGIMDLVSFYGDYMALAAQAMGVNLFNSRLAYVFGAKNQATAESFKKAFDRVASGDPAVVVDKSMFTDDGDFSTPFFEQNVGQNYISDRLIEALLNIDNMFCTTVGIPNANYNKRERTASGEIGINNFETRCMADSWLEGWRESCEKTKQMFGIDISVDWRENKEEFADVLEQDAPNSQLSGPV